MWHEISLRIILGKAIRLQELLGAKTASYKQLQYKIASAQSTVRAHIDRLFTNKIFQKYAQNFASMIANDMSFNTYGRTIEMINIDQRPLRSNINDNAHVNRRATQGRDPCRRCFREQNRRT